jgi:CRISPR-associated protein Cmr4
MSTTVKKYQTLVFRLQALTNLHAGSGNSFYGAVDKLVQRDPATRRPTIHSHSLKGALREYFESEAVFEKGTDSKNKFITHVFGSPVSGDANASEQGNYRFFSADLLALPVPDENPNSSTAFHLETANDAWTKLCEKTRLLGSENWTSESLRTAFENDSKYQESGRFKNASDELPVVARNQLDNGESQNLWYEELVPHESIFGFLVQIPFDPENKDDLNGRVEFTSKLNGKVIQIGANASVGYGFCLLTLLNPPSKP